MTKEGLKECYPGDWVEVNMWDRTYECQIIRLEDYDADGLPDKAMVAGKILTIVKPEQLTWLRHDKRIEELLAKVGDDSCNELQAKLAESNSRILRLRKIIDDMYAAANSGRLLKEEV